ncbi:MAG: hypothetical protein FJY20_00005 [Bacteroidetes bacterium]|nr:hypothetical protein [Bacteroidota bacterium]MBM3419337.1 hypothetical protein [Bacteroidota bacterium]
MTDKPKIKRLIAREVLIFFVSLTLVGLLWLFLIIRNTYYDTKISSSQKRIASITAQIDSLPTDRLKALYEGIKQKFIVNYIVGADNYNIPKQEEPEFLKDFPNAKPQPSSETGYSYMKNKHKFDYIGAVKVGYTSEEIQKYLSKNYYYYSINLNEIKKNGMSDKDINTLLNQDSLFLFEYISLDKFKECLKSELYKNKLYEIFSSDLDIGTKASYDSKVDDGLKYESDVIVKREKLENEKKDAQSLIEKGRRNIVEDRQLTNILLWTIIIIGVIVYPLRLCLIAIKWSVTTLRKNAT